LQARLLGIKNLDQIVMKLNEIVEKKRGKPADEKVAAAI
jgi:hypothetical protein